jgi:hypothetical protein
VNYFYIEEDFMQNLRNRYLIPIFLGAILIVGFFLLLPASQASAQCGSQASSCKDCHETQGDDPVNNDGTAWHTQHVQIDACVSCHAGNPQSTDKDQSHTGMVAWESDVKAGCAMCHPDDYMQLAQEYATTLGVTLGGGGAVPPVEPPPDTPATATEETAPPEEEIVVVQPGTVDYVQQYNETVLGETSVNWGDVILVVLILCLLFAGGAFVYWNERRRKGLKGFYTKKTIQPVEGTVPVVEGYSSDVTELLPLIAKLNPVGLHALKRLLANPDQANEMLHSLSHLDPELVRRIQSLDKDTRALLIALAGS